MKSLVIGLIGCGLWGRNILRELQNLGAHTVVIDPHPEARKYAMQHGALETAAELKNATTVDGYILSTPASQHAEQLEELLTFDKPIFTEKPFVLTLEDALRLKDLGKGRIFVMHVWRYHPAVQKLKEIIESNQLGKVEMIRTRRCNWTSPRKDVDPIWTLLPHDISIFTELTGQVPRATHAIAEYCESRPVGMLAFTDAGCPCIAEVSTRYPEKIREIRVHGSEGVAVMPQDGNLIQLHSGNDTSLIHPVEVIAADGEPALRNEIRAFLTHLIGERPPNTGLDNAVEITRCITDLRTIAGLTNP